VEHTAPVAAKGADRFAPDPRRVTQVVLVGGATRMPAIREFVAAVTGIEPQA
jgi:molecular chaperone DnaK